MLSLVDGKVIPMDKKYWRRRRSTALAAVRKAALARTRFMPLRPVRPTASEPTFLLCGGAPGDGEKLALGTRELGEDAPDAEYYWALEEGARFLADQALDPAARSEHLKMARIYRDRAADPSRTRRR